MLTQSDSPWHGPTVTQESRTLCAKYKRRLLSGQWHRVPTDGARVAAISAAAAVPVGLAGGAHPAPGPGPPESEGPGTDAACSATVPVPYGSTRPYGTVPWVRCAVP